MSGNPAEHLKNKAQEDAQRKQQERDRLKIWLEDCVEELNKNTNSGLPQVVMKGSSLKLDRFTLYLDFEQLWENPTDYVLVLRVGDEGHRMFGSEPPAVRHKLQPTVSGHLNTVAWVDKTGNLGRFTSDELAKFALDMLINYYRQYKPH